MSINAKILLSVSDRDKYYDALHAILQRRPPRIVEGDTLQVEVDVLVTDEHIESYRQSIAKVGGMLAIWEGSPECYRLVAISDDMSQRLDELEKYLVAMRLLVEKLSCTGR